MFAHINRYIQYCQRETGGWQQASGEDSAAIAVVETAVTVSGDRDAVQNYPVLVQNWYTEQAECML